MKIKFELTPDDLDMIFFALQHAPMPVGYARVKDLIDRINEQGQPQLQAQAAIMDVQPKEPGNEAA